MAAGVFFLPDNKSIANAAIPFSGYGGDIECHQFLDEAANSGASMGCRIIKMPSQNVEGLLKELGVVAVPEVIQYLKAVIEEDYTTHNEKEWQDETAALLELAKIVAVAHIAIVVTQDGSLVNKIQALKNANVTHMTPMQAPIHLRTLRSRRA